MQINNLFFNWVVNQPLFKQAVMGFSLSTFAISPFLTIGNLSLNPWRLS